MDGWSNIFQIVFAGLATTALSGTIIFGLSNWLGKVWANRILEEERQAYRKEIEKYKQELDKARTDYQRFSSKKFQIIEETWNAVFGIIKELKIINKLDKKEDYINNLESNLNIISDYLTLIRKNSLYFDDDISVLLSRYITACSEVTHSANEKIYNCKTDDDLKNQFGEIAKEIYIKAIQRDELLDEIKIKFRLEIRGN